MTTNAAPEPRPESTPDAPTSVLAAAPPVPTEGTVPSGRLHRATAWVRERTSARPLLALTLAVLLAAGAAGAGGFALGHAVGDDRAGLARVDGGRGGHAPGLDGRPGGVPGGEVPALPEQREDGADT